MYLHFPTIERCRLERGGRAKVAHTDWPLSLMLTDLGVVVLEQCCSQLQQGVEEDDSPTGITHCIACGVDNEPTNKSYTNKPWPNLRIEHLRRWLEDAGLNTLEAEFYADELAQDLNVWLVKSRVHISSFCPMGQRRARDVEMAGL